MLQIERKRALYYGFLLLEQKKLFCILAKAFCQNSHCSKKQNILILGQPQNQALICFRPPENQLINAQDLLESLRLLGETPYPELLIIAPFGLDKTAQEILEQLDAKYTSINFNELLQILQEHDIPLPEIQKTARTGRKNFLKRIAPLMENKRSPRVLIKYALLLCLLSILTPFYIYYLIVAGIFLTAGIYIKYRQKHQSRNIF